MSKTRQTLGMRNLPRYAHFRMETREHRGILRNADGQEFNRDDLGELQIFGAVDFAHSRRAQAAQQSDSDRLRSCQARNARLDRVTTGK